MRSLATTGIAINTYMHEIRALIHDLKMNSKRASEAYRIRNNIEEAVASQTTPEKGDNIEAVDNTVVAAEDDGADLVVQLAEAIQLQNELESKIKVLNEKLSVCYTKETRYVEALRRNKSQIKQLSSDKLALEESLSNAQTRMATQSKEIEELNQTIKH